MRYKLSIFVIMAFLMLSPLILASQETLGTFKSGECVNLRQTCGNCTYTNITQVLYPDSSLALGDVQMEKNDINYNYTFCNTQQNGEYIVVGYSDVDGIKTTWAYRIIITPTGVIENSILNNSIVIILLVLAIALLCIAVFMHSYPMYFLSGVMWTVAGVYTMIYGFNSYTDTFTQSIALVFIAIGSIFMLTTGYEWVSNITDPEEGSVENKDESDYFNKQDGD